MDDFSEMCTSRALRPGFDEILIPGEQEARRVQRKTEIGVPLEDPAIEDLHALADELGVGTRLEVLGPWEDDRL